MAFHTPEEQVFEYTRRRFDGGPEIEAIQMIEWHLQMMEQQHQMAQVSGQLMPPVGQPVPVMAGPMPSAPVAPVALGMHPGVSLAPQMAVGPMPAPMAIPAEPSAAPTPDVVPATLQGKWTKAFVLPHLELVLGVIGIITCMLMKLSAVKGNHPFVAQADAERQALLAHSQNVVRTSLRDIKLSPLRFLQMCLL